MPADARTALLTRRYQEQVRRIGERASARIARVWDELPGHDEADIPTFAARVEPILAEAHRASVQAATAFYALLGQVRPPTVDPDEVAMQFDPRAPFIAYWRSLKMSARG